MAKILFMIVTNFREKIINYQKEYHLQILLFFELFADCPDEQFREYSNISAFD